LDYAPSGAYSNSLGSQSQAWIKEWVGRMGADTTAMDKRYKINSMKMTTTTETSGKVFVGHLRTFCPWAIDDDDDVKQIRRTDKLSAVYPIV